MAYRIEEPQIITSVVGTNIVTGHTSTSTLYDGVTQSNVKQIFTNHLTNIGDNIYGSKALVYINNEGKDVVAFFTESIDTHHVQVGSKLAEMDGWSQDITKPYYNRQLKGPSSVLLQRQFGFDFLYDKSSGKIVQIRMSSAIANSQIQAGIKFERTVLEDSIQSLFDRIDPRLLDNKFKDFKWLDDPGLKEEIMPSALVKLILMMLLNYK